MRLVARLGMAVAVLVATTATVLGATAGPAAAAGCWGLGCHGYDVNYMGCAVSSVVGPHAAKDPKDGVVVAYVENRYSYGCNANWARGWLTQAGIDRGYRIQVVVTTYDSQVPSVYEQMCVPNAANNTGTTEEDCSGTFGGSTAVLFTDMVDGHNKTYAYVHVWSGSTFVVQGEADQ